MARGRARCSTAVLTLGMLPPVRNTAAQALAPVRALLFPWHKPWNSSGAKRDMSGRTTRTPMITGQNQ